MVDTNTSFPTLDPARSRFRGIFWITEYRMEFEIERTVGRIYPIFSEIVEDIRNKIEVLSELNLRHMSSVSGITDDAVSKTGSTRSTTSVTAMKLTHRIFLSTYYNMAQRGMIYESDDIDDKCHLKGAIILAYKSNVKQLPSLEMLVPHKYNVAAVVYVPEILRIFDDVPVSEGLTSDIPLSSCIVSNILTRWGIKKTDYPILIRLNDGRFNDVIVKHEITVDLPLKIVVSTPNVCYTIGESLRLIPYVHDDFMLSLYGMSLAQPGFDPQQMFVNIAVLPSRKTLMDTFERMATDEVRNSWVLNYNKGYMFSTRGFIPGEVNHYIVWNEWETFYRSILSPDQLNEVMKLIDRYVLRSFYSPSVNDPTIYFRLSHYLSK